MVVDTDRLHNRRRPGLTPTPVPPRLTDLDLGDRTALPRSLAMLDKMLRFVEWPFDQPEGWPHEGM